jgi:Icc protein
MKLIWITDPHLVEPGRDWPQGVDPAHRLSICLDEVMATHPDADRLILSGDLIQLGNPGAYRVLRSALARLPMPYRLMVGNHDDRRALLEAFPETQSIDGFIQSAEDLGSARLVYLDTLASDGKHTGELCQTREHWLSEQFARAGEGQLLIFLHHPPFDIGVPALDHLKLQNTVQLARLLRRRSSPTYLFAGHVHRHVTGLWAGHSIATLKSTHVQFALNMTASTLERSAEPPGYGIILGSEDGLMLNYRDLTPRD